MTDTRRNAALALLFFSLQALATEAGHSAEAERKGMATGCLIGLLFRCGGPG